MRPRISSRWASASSWVIFSFFTRLPSCASVTCRAFSSPVSTNSCFTSLRSTGMPADATTWATSPPIVPAPTTAALKTNIAAQAIGAPRAGGRVRRASCLGAHMGHPGRTVDAEVARIASGAHGVVTRAQLLDAGVTAKQIRRRVAAGSLIRVHPGVYRAGHRAPSTEASYLAAVLAAGDDAVVSGLAAAHLWELVKGAAPSPEVASLTERRIQGVRTHRCRFLNASDVAAVRGIPVTSVSRTLVDIAAALSA